MTENTTREAEAEAEQTIHRRSALAGIAGAGVFLLAGCTAGEGDEEEGPLYDEELEGEDELGLPPEVVHELEEDLEAVDKNPHFEWVYANEDETMFVLARNQVFETVDEAKENLEKSRETAGDHEDLDIADEAFYAEVDDFASVIFRHSNAKAEVKAVRQSGFEIEPDRTRAIRYAREMFEHWQEQHE